MPPPSALSAALLALLAGSAAALTMRAPRAALPPAATPLEKETARTKKASELFAAYAKEYSTCPSKKEGGDLSFFPRVGAMVEPASAGGGNREVHHWVSRDHRQCR